MKYTRKALKDVNQGKVLTDANKKLLGENL